MGQKGFYLLIVIIGAALIGQATLYTVDEREKAIVFKFGEIVRASDEPGIHVKIPIINNVQFFDARLQTMDAAPELYLTKEKKNLLVDSFVKWRINDVAKFYVTMGGSSQTARSRLAQLVNNGLRDEFGKREIAEVISGDRVQIMQILQENTDKQADEYGIEVLDVRLKRIDYDEEISDAVYDRMVAERARVAKDLRAKGAEAAERLRADADRQREVILAEAYRDAELIRGEGDSRATAIYAQAFGQDEEFYSFYRSLTAYKEAFGKEQDFLLIEPDSDFFKYFRKPEK